MASESEAAVFPPLSCSDVLACRYSSWYPLFRKHSPKATIIKPLEDRFIDYLDSDRVFLPDGSGPVGLSELSDSDDGNGSDSSQDLSWQVRFTELDAEIRKVILKYDGAVFPKLNWSSPQDAAWMMPGSTLKCQCPADVYLLLKSSDFITHDLDHAFDDCVDAPPESRSMPSAQTDGLEASTANMTLGNDDIAERGGASSTELVSDSEGESGPSPKSNRSRPYDFELVLKKWFDMPRSQEWRCFVRDQRLVGISQRDTAYYDFLQSELAQAEVRSKIFDFFSTTVKPSFPNNSYTFDVYFTRSNDRLFLIDFNPFAAQTDALLFSWSELLSFDRLAHDEGPPPLRIVQSESMAAQSMPSFSHNRYPKDVLDLSTGGSIAEFAQKWNGALEEGVFGSDKESSTSSTRRVGR